MVEFMFCKIFLLIFPISLLLGLIRRQEGLFLKLFFWSFRVMNASVFAGTSILSPIPNSEAIFLSDFIRIFSLSLLVFLYYFCMFSFNNLSYKFPLYSSYLSYQLEQKVWGLFCKES